MLKTKAIHVLINASSGLSARENAPQLVAGILQESGAETFIHSVEKGHDICELVRNAVRDGADVVVAGGGDGTLNAVASVLAGTDVAMGVLPCGTLNHFARDLSIPLDMEGASRIIAGGRTIQVDIGEVNGKRFINNAIIGLYPIYRFQRERNQKQGHGKWRSILSAVLSVLNLNPALHIRVDADGENLARRTPFLMVANNQHEMEGYHLGNRQTLAGGRLYLYMMRRMTRWGLLKLAFSVLLGRFSKMKDFDVVSACELTVRSRRKRIGISLDGEVIRMATPLQYRSLAGALRVIVPADYVAGE